MIQHFWSRSNRRCWFAVAAALFVSGVVFGLPQIPGSSSSPTPGATTAVAEEQLTTPEQARTLLEAAQKEGVTAFTLRTGASGEEYAEYIHLLGQVVSEGDAARVRVIAAPEFREEASRIDAQIKAFHAPDVTPDNSLEIYDQARTSAQIAGTWVDMIAEFSDAESARESVAFDEVRKQQQSLQDLQRTPALTPMEQWRLTLQELRLSAAYALYQTAQDSSLRDAEERMEKLEEQLNSLIIESIKSDVTFPESVLQKHLDALDKKREEVVTTGGKIADALASVAQRAAAADPETVAGYWLQARANSLDRQLQSNQFQRLLLEMRADLWRERHSLWASSDAREFMDARSAIMSTLRDLQTWQPIVTSKLREVRRQQADALEAAPADAGPPPSEVVDAYSQEEVVVDGLALAFDAVQNLAALSRMDIDERASGHGVAGVTQRVERTLVKFSDAMAAVWTFELFELKDSYTLNEQVIERSSSVTVGMLVTALLILGVGAVFSNRFSKWLSRRLQRRFHLDDNTAVIVEKFSHYLLMVALLLVALGIVRIPLTIFALLGGAAAIAVGFGAQQLVNNLISGVILLFERPIRIGDRIEVETYSGTVTAIGTRCSRLRRPDGVEILIPNSVLLQNTLVNWTLSDKLCRQEFLVGVAYGAAVDVAAKLIRSVLDEHPNVLGNPEPMVLLHDFADSSLELRLLYWIDTAIPNAILLTPSELRFAIYRKLDEAGIGIPFPQRDVHIDTTHPIAVEVISRPETK